MLRPSHNADQPWSLTNDQLCGALSVDPERGLSRLEVARRLKTFGPNTLRKTKKTTAWEVLVRQLQSVIVALLAAGAALSFALQETLEGFAILVVIVINTAIGFITEMRAVRSTEALRRLGTTETTVRREGELRRIPAERLVPGDIVVFEGGDVVTSDVRLLEASRVQANESTLTGESLPVSKHTDPVDERTPLAERQNMLFKGTAVTRGMGEGAITATGMRTELGKITSLVEEVEDVETPLEKRINDLGKVLAVLCIVFVVLVAIAGLTSGKELGIVLRTAIALAIATVPEGLPIVATLALGRGVLRMARRNALVEQLSAVEALGSTNVILTDKTGTLTENRMTVVKLAAQGVETDWGDDEVDLEPFDALVTTAALCTEASPDAEYVSDPMEAALIAAAGRAGHSHAELLREWPRVGEEAFDPKLKMMATFHSSDEGVLVAVKGAPEQVLNTCSAVQGCEGSTPINDDDRQSWLATNERLAGRGLRLLGVARKKVSDEHADPYRDLTLLGLVGLLDPPRKTVRESLAQARTAGVKVVMVTGDQAATARSIARSIGMIDGDEDGALTGEQMLARLQGTAGQREQIRKTHVFARTDPEQKLRLLEYFQERGEIVAMIGDGVNDAPALKKSDIGVAMGKRGTQVAREAADIVLRDDEFSTIVVAIAEGRVIFRNIRSFVVYLLSCNVSEILTVGIASIANAPLPILPLQILFLNLVTDIFPALALGVSEGDDGVMQRPPRNPKEPFLTKWHWTKIGGYSLLMTLSVLAGLAISLLVWDMEVSRAVTISFLTLAGAQIAHVFNMAGADSAVFNNEITRNPWVWGAVVLCICLVLASVYAPGLSDVLSTQDPTPRGWGLVAILSLIPLVVGYVVRIVRRTWGRIKGTE